MRSLIFLALQLFSLVLFSQHLHRDEILIPDIPGYQTLKCDFHVHTVFSDGDMWPESRVREAWAEGLDGFAFTDHIEYHPHIQDVVKGHNRAYEIAKNMAAAFGLILLNGAEITREDPMGHFNAVGLRDVAALDIKDSVQAVKIAHEQGAFIFYNHPGGEKDWTPLHEAYRNRGELGGVEVVNENKYYPHAHKWCLEKNLTMIGTSDTHYPLSFLYQTSGYKRRPLTLVFAGERSQAGILEALKARRTAVFYTDKLIGREEHLRPIVNRSLEIQKDFFIDLKSDYWEGYCIIKNTGDIPFTLIPENIPVELSIDEEIRIPPRTTVALWISLREKKTPGTYSYTIPCTLPNILVAPNEGMKFDLNFTVSVR